LNDLFDIQELAYDDWNAEIITQHICEGIRDPITKQITMKGTRIPRLVFSQGIQAFNEATKEFERRVIQGKILHNGDPCLSWQVQHATLRQDTNNNIKPIKPKEGDVRKVDGLIVGIMAMQRAIAMPRKGTIYRRGGGIKTL
jgi:phage terminase large subunit-like protein